MSAPMGFRTVTIRARVRRTDNAFQVTECLGGVACSTGAFLVNASGENLRNLTMAASGNLVVEVIGLVAANATAGQPLVIGVQTVRVFSAEGRPGPLPLGSVVDIRARVESIGPGAYRTTECLGGPACPAILMVPSAETQARLNAAQLNNFLAEIHGTITSFQPGGTPVISVSSVRTAGAAAGGPRVFVSQFADCLSRCLQREAHVLIHPATLAARLVLCGLAAGVGSFLTTPLTIPQLALVCLAAGLSVDATLLASCIAECLGRS